METCVENREEDFFQVMEGNIMKKMKDMALIGAPSSPSQTGGVEVLSNSPVFNYDRVVSLLVNNEVFDNNVPLASPLSRMSTLPPQSTTSNEIPKTRFLRHRTSSLPSLSSANLQKTYCTSRNQSNNLIEKEKTSLRRNMWQERILYDNHFPVKFLGSKNDTVQDKASTLMKRSHDMTSESSLSSRRFSEDFNDRNYFNLMDSPDTLISCISGVLCSYMMNVSNLNYDPNEKKETSDFSRPKASIPVPSPTSKRSISPASPSIFNNADARNYLPVFAFVPKSFRNELFNQTSAQGTIKSNTQEKKFAEEVTVPIIQNFIQHVYSQSQMEKECLVIALLYIERVLFLSSTNDNTFRSFYLTTINWCSFIMTALLIASKMWDDFSMINGDFVAVMSNYRRMYGSLLSSTSTLTSRNCSSLRSSFDLQHINILEAKFLSLIGFNVCVTGEDYARVYFRLTEIITIIKIKKYRQGFDDSKSREAIGGENYDEQDSSSESPNKKIKTENDESKYSQSDCRVAPWSVSKTSIKPCFPSSTARFPLLSSSIFFLSGAPVADSSWKCSNTDSSNTDNRSESVDFDLFDRSA